MKTARVSVQAVSDLLQDARLKDLKLVLMVRDPRAVMYSRSHLKWCQESNFCRDETFLCSDMSEDFDSISLLQKDHGSDRVTFLRFEDFASLPKREFLDLADFLKLPYTEEIENYLESKIDFATGQLASMNEEQSPNAWQTKMHFASIDKIQKSCKDAMNKWGYKALSYQDLQPNRAVLPKDKMN